MLPPPSLKAQPNTKAYSVTARGVEGAVHQPTYEHPAYRLPRPRISARVSITPGSMRHMLDSHHDTPISAASRQSHIHIT